MDGNWLVHEKWMTVTLWVITVCKASEEICNKHPTLLASASLKIRATSKDSLWTTKTPNHVNLSRFSANLPILSYTYTNLVRAEAHIPKMQDRGEDSPDGGDLISMQTNRLKTLKQNLEVVFVLLPPQFTGTTLKGDNNNKKTDWRTSHKLETRENCVQWCKMYLV